jgi:hypothetical protein
MSIPARPGTCICVVVCSSISTSPRRARARPRNVPWRDVIAPGRQPRRAVSQPSRRSPETSEPSRICAVTDEIVPSSGRRFGVSNAPAMRSRHGVVRSQARSTT